MNFLLYNISVIVLALSSCSISSSIKVEEKKAEFINIKNFGVHGNGITDDQPAIQKAFRSGYNLFFPKGKYLLKTKTDAQSILLITEDGYPRRIRFEKGAVLIVSPSQPTDYIKPAVIRIIAKKSNIEYIEFDGLSIDGNRNKHSINNSGLVVLDHKKTSVKNLILKNITIKNVGWNAIHTQAMNNEFYNIYTENNGLHGIGIINYSHKNEVGKFYLDGMKSVNDEGYSIDFSGPKNKGVALAGFTWEGKVKNVFSSGSKYGIKTAGNWDLEMENIMVKNSKNHGFFINVDAPGHCIKIRDMTLKDNKGNALNLRGVTRIEGEHIDIENCGKGILNGKTNGFLNDVNVKGGPNSILGVQIGGVVKDFEITNFKIHSFNKKIQYPMRIKGQTVRLSNGSFENNKSVNEILIYPEAEEVLLENIVFKGHSDKKQIVNGVRTLQKEVTTQIINCDFSKLNGKAIQNPKHFNIKRSKGINKNDK